MKLEFRCVDCGKFLGVYMGEGLWLSGKKLTDGEEIKLRCLECHLERAAQKQDRIDRIMGKEAARE